MNSKFSIFLAVLGLVLASLACSLTDTELSLTNLPTALDSDGQNPTTVFSPEDVFFAVRI